MMKRYVVKNSWELGIESDWENDRGTSSPFWYVYDKKEQRIVEGTEGESKAHVYKIACRMNG